MNAQTPRPTGAAVLTTSGERVTVFSGAAVQPRRGGRALIAGTDTLVMALTRNGASVLVELQPRDAVRLAACLLATAEVAPLAALNLDTRGTQ